MQRKVWVLLAAQSNGGDTIVDIFDSKEKAEAKQANLESWQEHLGFHVEMWVVH